MISPIIGSAGSQSTSATNFTSISDTGTLNSWQTTDALASTPMPASFTLSALYVECDTAPGAGKNYVYTIMKNGSATALTVIIADTNTSAIDTSDTVSFVAGDTISFRSVPTGTPTAPSKLRWNLLTSGTGQPHVTRSNTATTTNTIFHVPSGRCGDTSETNATSVMPCAGTFSALYAKLDVAPGVGNTKVFVLRVNGVSTTLTCTISDTATTANDLSHTVSVNAGDTISIQVSATGTPASSTPYSGILFTPTVDGQAVIFYGQDGGANASTAAVNYNLIQAQGIDWGATETSFKSVLGNWFIDGIAFRTPTASGGGKSYTMTLRKNGADTPLTIIANNTTASQWIDASIFVGQGDWLTLAATPTGTPTASKMQVSLLIDVGRSSGPANYVPSRVKVGDGMSRSEMAN